MKQAWKLIVAILFLISGIGTFGKSVGVAIFTLVIAAGFAYWWYKSKNMDTESVGAMDVKPYDVKVLSPTERQALLSRCEIPNPGIRLSSGEKCYYAGAAQAYTTKNVVVGSRSRGSGINIRIAKGISYHTGGGGRKNIRRDVSETFNGTFYLTNQRVMLLAPKHGFNIPHTKLMSVVPANDGFQFYDTTGKCYTMLTRDSAEIRRRMNLIEA